MGVFPKQIGMDEFSLNPKAPTIRLFLIFIIFSILLYFPVNRERQEELRLKTTLISDE